VKQLVQREQISMLPPSLELLRKVETELAAIEKLYDEATVRHRVAALSVEIAKVTRPWWRAADAPRHAGRRSGRGALAAGPLRQSSVALRSHGFPEAMKHEAIILERAIARGWQCQFQTDPLPRRIVSESDPL
jgi:hypothetical protein